MCGIAGLFLKNPALEPQLGAMLAEMLAVLSDRGPDSAGFAVYGSGTADSVKFTLRAGSEAEMADFATALQGDFPSAQILPPCLEMIRCTIASPMPVPSKSSAECKRWKTPKSLS